MNDGPRPPESEQPPIQLKKLTLRAIGTMPATAPATPRSLGLVLGIITNYKITATDIGSQAIFTGHFEAIEGEPSQLSVTDVLVTKKIYNSTKMVMPPAQEKQLLNSLHQAQKADGKAQIEFALEFTATPRNNAFGYEVTSRFHLGPKIYVADPLGELRIAALALQADSRQEPNE